MINETGTFMDERDGIKYKTIKIGNQVWMAENLVVSKYRNGDPIPQVQDSEEWEELETGAWSYYLNKEKYGETYGKLYNWYAINDSRRLAPQGWHIPSDAEWATLIKFLGGRAGCKLKEADTTHWSKPNVGATNEIGFTALPGGARGFDGDFDGINKKGFWWSSTENNSDDAWYYSMYNDLVNVLRYDHDKRIGYSVRCLMD